MWRERKTRTDLRHHPALRVGLVRISYILYSYSDAMGFMNRLLLVLNYKMLNNVFQKYVVDLKTKRKLTSQQVLKRSLKL